MIPTTSELDTSLIGIAVLGCGGWGINHVRTWHELGNLRVACDPDPDRLALMRSEFRSVDLSDDPGEVLERDDVHAVVIASPASTHAEIARRAIQAGKHLLVEKPLATNVEDAEEIVEAAKVAGVTLMVGHVLEYHPAFLKLRELVADGAVGKLLYVYSHRLNFGRVRTEESALWSFAPHDVALCLRLVDYPVEAVSCHGVEHLSPGVADLTTMNLRFSDGRQAHIFVSWLHPFKEHRVVVVGDKQMAVFDDTAPWAEKLLLYPHRVDWLDGRVPVARRAEAEPVEIERAEPLRVECERFLEAIRTGIAPLTDGHSGLEVLRVLAAGEESLRGDGLAIEPQRSGSSLVTDAFVHPTATIDDRARIGSGSKVWHYSHVMSDASIGRRCSLGQNVFVGRGVRIGNGVKIQNNVSVYEGVEIEDDVFCGPSVVFTNVLNPKADVERKDEFRATLVRKGATLGANATIVCGVTIGRHAFVGAGAAVTRDVPDQALVVGVPARFVGWMCRCGERLSDDGRVLTCRGCGTRYQLENDNLRAAD